MNQSIGLSLNHFFVILCKVEGIPQYTQKIFGALLHLQQCEHNILNKNPQLNHRDDLKVGGHAPYTFFKH